MHIFNNIKNFLYDNDNFIAYFNNKIYLYNIEKIDVLSNDYIVLYFNDKRVEIKGNYLKPINCLKKELILQGKIESVSLYDR